MSTNENTSTGWGMMIVPLKWRFAIMHNGNGEWLIGIGPLRFAKMRNVA